MIPSSTRSIDSSSVNSSVDIRNMEMEEEHDNDSDSDHDYVPISYTEQVFKRRLATLTSLKTREGGDYERPEDFESRKHILATRVKLVTDLKLELRRRYEIPSDLDEVKFALFEIIDTICESEKKQKEEHERQIRDPDLNRGQQFHHITTNGFLMTKLSGRDPFLDFLKLNENNPDLVLRPKIFGRKSNNDRSQLVTDMTFVDMIVSSSGMMLPVTRHRQPGGSSILGGGIVEESDGPLKHGPTFGFGAIGSVSSDDESSEIIASKHTPSIDAIPEGDEGSDEEDRYGQKKEPKWIPKQTMTEKTVAVLQGMGTLIKVLLQQKLGIGKKKKKLAVQEDTEEDANKLTDSAGSLLVESIDDSVKEKPFNTHFPDAVSVTVTVLLDPPPHFIWQVDEVKTKAAMDAYKLRQKQKQQQQRKGKDKDNDKEKETKRIEEEVKKRKEEKKKKAAAEEEENAVDEDGNIIEKEEEEEGGSDDDSSPAKSPLGMVVSVAHGGSIERSHLSHDQSVKKGELGTNSDDEFEDLFPPTPMQILPNVLTDPMPSTMKKWDMGTGKGTATKTRPYNYEDDELNYVTKPKRGKRLPVAPPLVGTKGAPGHYTILGHQPASDMAVTKSQMTRDDVEEGLRVMKLALLEKEIKARTAKEERRHATHGSKEVAKNTIPPSNTSVNKTDAIGDIAPVVGFPHKKPGSGKSKLSKGSRKGPKKDPNRIRGADSDDDDDFDDEDWDEDDYDSEGNYIAGDREAGEEGEHEDREGEKPGGVDDHDDGGVVDPPAAVAAAPPEPWAVRRKRELAEKKAKEQELLASGSRKDSIISSLGKAWKNLELPMPTWKMDRSAMEAFEKQWTQEIAAAVCLPEENIFIDEIRRLPHDDPKLVRLLAEDEKAIAAARQKTSRREFHHIHHDDHSDNHKHTNKYDKNNQETSMVPSGGVLLQHGDHSDHDAIVIPSNDQAMVALDNNTKIQNNDHGDDDDDDDDDDDISVPLVGSGTWKAAIATVTAASVPLSLDGLTDKQQRQERINKLQRRGDRFISEAERLAMEIPPTRYTLLRDHMLQLIRHINELVKDTQEEWMEGRYDLLDDLKELYDELKQDMTLLARTATIANASRTNPSTATSTATTLPIVAIASQDASSPLLLTAGEPSGVEGQGGIPATTAPSLSAGGPPTSLIPTTGPPTGPPPHNPPSSDQLPPVDEPWAVKRKREKLEEQQRKEKEKNQQDAVLAALDASNHNLVAGGGGIGSGGVGVESLGGGVAVIAPVVIPLSQTKNKSPDKTIRSSTTKSGQGQGQSQGGCLPSLLKSPLKLPLVSSLLSLTTNVKPEISTGPLIGCEITFTILLTDDNREVLNLPDLEAIDLPLLLAKQLLEESSMLKQGVFTRHVLDVRYRPSHNRRMFDRWEDYWSHRLHPVYFGRSVNKRPKFIPPKETSPFILEAMTPIDEDLEDNATATDSFVKKLLEEAQMLRNMKNSGDTVASSVPLQVERYPMVHRDVLEHMAWMEGLHAFNSTLSMLSINQITSFLSLAKECEDNANDGNEANWEEEFWEKVGLNIPKFEKMGIKDFQEMFQQVDTRVENNENARALKEKLEMEEAMAKRRLSALKMNAEERKKDKAQYKTKKKTTTYVVEEGPKSTDIVVDEAENNDFIVEMLMGYKDMTKEEIERQKEFMRFYRPSTLMAMVTPNVVDRLKTQHRKFAKRYLELIKPGYLEKPKDYMDITALMTLRKRDAALGLYNVAKSVLNQQKRKIIRAALEQEKLRAWKSQLLTLDDQSAVATTINSELKAQAQWLKDMEEERFEHTKWRVKGIRERRELRKQEERLNLLDEEMNVWMVERLANVAPIPDKKVLKLRLEAELRRNIVETEKFLRQRKETMGPIAKAVYEGKLRQRTLNHMASLSERKRTRQLIGMIVMWVQRVKRICRYNARMNDAVNKDAADVSPSTNDAFSKSQKEFVKATKKAARKNKEAVSLFNATSGARLLWQMAFRRRDETYQTISERLAKAEEKAVDHHGHHSPLLGKTPTITLEDYVKNLAHVNATSSTGRKASVNFLIHASETRKHIRFHSMARALDETDQSFGYQYDEVDFDDEDYEFDEEEDKDTESSVLRLKRVYLMAFVEVVRLSRLNEEYLEALEERRIQKQKRDMARAERAAWKKRIREEKLRTQEQPKIKPLKNYAHSDRSDMSGVGTSTKSLPPVSSPNKQSDNSPSKKSDKSNIPDLLPEFDEEDEEKEEEEEPLLRPYSVPAELRLLPDERELAGMVGWMGLVQKSDEFWEVLWDLPSEAFVPGVSADDLDNANQRLAAVNEKQKAEGDGSITNSKSNNSKSNSNTLRTKEKEDEERKTYLGPAAMTVAREEIVMFSTVVSDVAPAYFAVIEKERKARQQADLDAQKAQKRKDEQEQLELSLNQAKIDQELAALTSTNSPPPKSLRSTNPSSIGKHLDPLSPSTGIAAGGGGNIGSIRGLSHQDSTSSMYTSSQKSDGDGLKSSQKGQVATVDKDFAWLTSHVHTYVLPFGGRHGSVDPFCTTCRERKEAGIVEQFEGKEKLWIDSFELFIEVQLAMKTKEIASKNVKSKWHGAKSLLGGGWKAVITAATRKGPETLENLDLGYPRLSDRMIHQATLKLGLVRLHPAFMLTGLSFYEPTQAVPLLIHDSCYGSNAESRKFNVSQLSLLDDENEDYGNQGQDGDIDNEAFDDDEEVGAVVLDDLDQGLGLVASSKRKKSRKSMDANSLLGSKAKDPSINKSGKFSGHAPVIGSSFFSKSFLSNENVSSNPLPKPKVNRGLMIRIWYLEEGQDVSVGEIVGYVLIDDDMLKEPARGRRSYAIQKDIPYPDNSIYDTALHSGLRERKRKLLIDENAVDMTLSEAARNKAAALKKAEALRKVYAASKPLLVLKFQVMRRIKGTNEPKQWKMEIVSASCLPQCLEKDPNKDDGTQSAAKKRKAARERQNHKPLSTCVCEVMWMGPADFEVRAPPPPPATAATSGITPTQALMSNEDDDDVDNMVDKPTSVPGVGSGLGADHVSVASGVSGVGGAPLMPLLSTPVVPPATTTTTMNNNLTTDIHNIAGGGGGSATPSDIDVYPNHLTVGQIVKVKGKDVLTQGEIKFIGVTAFAGGYWVGLELSSGVGKNDGSVMGQRYFHCNNNDNNDDNKNTDDNHDFSNEGGAAAGVGVTPSSSHPPPRGLFVRAHQLEYTPTSVTTHPQMDTLPPVNVNVPPSQPPPTTSQPLPLPTTQSQPPLQPHAQELPQPLPTGTVGEIVTMPVRPSVGKNKKNLLGSSVLHRNNSNATSVSGIQSLVQDIHAKASPIIKTIAINEWVSLGSTRKKNVLGSRSPCPRFTEQDQASIFLLPPVWKGYKDVEDEMNEDGQREAKKETKDEASTTMVPTDVITHNQSPSTQTPERHSTPANVVESITPPTSDLPTHGVVAVNQPSLDTHENLNFDPSTSIVHLSSQTSNHSHSQKSQQHLSKTASFALPDAEKGEWVPRNFDFRPYTGVMTSERGSKLMQTKRTLTFYTLTLSLMLVQEWRRKALLTPGSTLERRKRDARKLLLECEEEERRCMAVEELQMRRFNLANSTDEYLALTEEQLALNREFCRIIALVMRPTTTLSRLRFYMGVQLEGGGIKITCSDPAATTNTRQGATALSRGIVDLIITPMLYPEDEEEMKRHIIGVQLTARYHPVLTPIIEYSVHEIRNYTSVGYIAAATRMGFCILERNFGPMLTDFLKNVEEVSDTLFITILIKVMEALVALHDANLLHRNLHPDAVVLTTKYKYNQHSKASTMKKRYKTSALAPQGTTIITCPLMRLDDYWFLRNNREAGCAFSEGRADWGNSTQARATAPPEVRGGYKISSATDVYAFGLCCITWSKCAYRMQDIDLLPQTDRRRAQTYKVKIANQNAALGRAVLKIPTMADRMNPADQSNAHNKRLVVLPPNEPLKNLSSLVPGRWNTTSWLHSLLRMCLQENPKLRATSKDVLDFLRGLDLSRYSSSSSGMQDGGTKVKEDDDDDDDEESQEEKEVWSPPLSPIGSPAVSMKKGVGLPMK